MNFKIQSELIEDQIEKDVSNFLGWITPDGLSRFRLISSDEQVTGADGEYRDGTIIYLQFKVSHGLKAISRLPHKLWKGSKLDAIREYRRLNGLHSNPTFYFQLREKAKNASDYQHNVLLGHHDPPSSYAAYVAPLSLTLVEYELALQTSIDDRYRLHPFIFYHTQEIRHLDRLHLVKFIPFLRGHISIVPHEPVSTHDHYYSFSKAGGDIAWHSVSKHIPGISRLSEFLFDIMYKVESKMIEPVSLETLYKTVLNKRVTDIDFQNNKENKMINTIQEYGKFVNNAYGITQLLLLRKNHLEVSN